MSQPIRLLPSQLSCASCFGDSRLCNENFLEILVKTVEFWVRRVQTKGSDIPQACSDNIHSHVDGMSVQVPIGVRVSEIEQHNIE